MASLKACTTAGAGRVLGQRHWTRARCGGGGAWRRWTKREAGDGAIPAAKLKCFGKAVVTVTGNRRIVRSFHGLSITAVRVGECSVVVRKPDGAGKWMDSGCREDGGETWNVVVEVGHLSVSGAITNTASTVGEGLDDGEVCEPVECHCEGRGDGRVLRRSAARAASRVRDRVHGKGFRVYRQMNYTAIQRGWREGKSERGWKLQKRNDTGRDWEPRQMLSNATFKRVRGDAIASEITRRDARAITLKRDGAQTHLHRHGGFPQILAMDPKRRAPAQPCDRSRPVSRKGNKTVAETARSPPVGPKERSEGDPAVGKAPRPGPKSNWGYWDVFGLGKEAPPTLEEPFLYISKDSEWIGRWIFRHSANSSLFIENLAEKQLKRDSEAFWLGYTCTSGICMSRSNAPD
ncbi:hypothetical protein DFP72DRAFT_843051 [Ephemerocybe angulata]|uniref:Uncharacterized protein n=1 Tax=Ephemerocybe angulata TaxID=980116 RepID=A0A8H6I8Y8_9AGAR|nr:hypothetical protein DFP72DRAFT_843051 [Tulosesus angulatus]